MIGGPLPGVVAPGATTSHRTAGGRRGMPRKHIGRQAPGLLLFIFTDTSAGFIPVETVPARKKPGPPKSLPPFTRICPSCGATVTHTHRINRNTARRLKKSCRGCENARRKIAYLGEANPFHGKKHTDNALAIMRSRHHPHVKTREFREGAAARMSGPQNQMRGPSVYELMVRKYGKDEADRRYALTKEKWSEAMAGAGNPMFNKPTPNGSGNGWSGWYKGRFFRSLRELSYMINIIEKQNLDWKTGETADMKIRYKGFNGASRTYRPDFLIGGKVLIEIKPTKLHQSPSVLAKSIAAE